MPESICLLSYDKDGQYCWIFLFFGQLSEIGEASIVFLHFRTADESKLKDFLDLIVIQDSSADFLLYPLSVFWNFEDEVCFP